MRHPVYWAGSQPGDTYELSKTTDGRIYIRAPLTRVPDAELTRRERDVLELLSEGLTTRTIADRLEISSITVRRHVGRS